MFKTACTKPQIKNAAVELAMYGGKQLATIEDVIETLPKPQQQKPVQHFGDFQFSALMRIFLRASIDSHSDAISTDVLSNLLSRILEVRLSSFMLKYAKVQVVSAFQVRANSCGSHPPLGRR